MMRIQQGLGFRASSLYQHNTRSGTVSGCLNTGRLCKSCAHVRSILTLRGGGSLRRTAQELMLSNPKTGIAKWCQGLLKVQTLVP